MKKMIKFMSVSNALLARSATDGNEDVSKLANKAIIDSFMPVSRTLLIEAKYLMNEQAKEMLNPWLVKQSISRGIQWMATHPIRNSEVMKYIFSHYALKESAETIINNEIVCETMEEVTALLEACVPAYAPSAPVGSVGLVEDMLDNWKHIWRKSVVYDVMSAIVFSQDPMQDFDWVEGVATLHAMDLAAWKEWSNS